MNRVVFLVDGFNLYHSTKDIYRYCNRLQAKWLDIRSLCSSLLYQISKDAKIESVYYFTAFAYFLKDPSVIRRHKNYIKCLETTDVKPEIARFKRKEVLCKLCKRQFIKHEEKETDVAICAKLLEVLLKGEGDTVVLMTGDTDLAPAVKTAKAIFSNKILFAFPYRRANDELIKIAPGSFKIDINSYIKNQLPDPFTLPDGRTINKPDSW